MADQIFMPRALDENGDTLTAYAYFYTAGTTTPLTVYANQTLTVTHPTPLPSDAAGAFPQVFVTSGTAVRTDVKDADTVEGSSLPGYPVDPSPVMSIASSAADGVTFAPITGNGSTNVQDAIAVNTARHEDRSDDVKDLLDASDDSEFRTKLGLGDLATENASNRTASQTVWNTGTATTEEFISPLKLTQKISNQVGPMVRAWARFDGVSGVTIGASYNIASITRTGIGVYDVVFTNGFAQYAVIASASRGGTLELIAGPRAYAASGFTLHLVSGAADARDGDVISFVVIG